MDTLNVRRQLLMKFDLSGNLIWKESYREGTFSKMVVANPNKIVCAGLVYDTITLSSINKDGQQIWTQNYRNAILNYVNQLILISDSGFSFVCESRDSLVKMYVVKTDSAGNIVNTTFINEAPQSDDLINCHYFNHELTSYLISELNENVNLVLYDIQGRLVISKELNYGSNKLAIPEQVINTYIAIYFCGNKVIKSFRFVSN